LSLLREDVKSRVLRLGHVGLLAQALHPLAIVATTLFAHDFEPGKIVDPEIDEDLNASVIGDWARIMA